MIPANPAKLVKTVFRTQVTWVYLLDVFTQLDFRTQLKSRFNLGWTQLSIFPVWPLIRKSCMSTFASIFSSSSFPKASRIFSNFSTSSSMLSTRTFLRKSINNLSSCLITIVNSAYLNKSHNCKPDKCFILSLSISVHESLDKI